ncbi:hypothetical protein CYMTET_24392, partial [Cymbomonas tetramitiformis]
PLTLWRDGCYTTCVVAGRVQYHLCVVRQAAALRWHGSALRAAQTAEDHATEATQNFAVLQVTMKEIQDAYAAVQAKREGTERKLAESQREAILAKEELDQADPAEGLQVGLRRLGFCVNRAQGLCVDLASKGLYRPR